MCVVEILGCSVLCVEGLSGFSSVLDPEWSICVIGEDHSNLDGDSRTKPA
ncbi:hypothetical protein GDO81_003700 [Engystomops pustulosus]|uniref:Uncharacterized protein n=1 Tax=Engystomops pustulosus TaxID=76066 RepID=A0AAV7A2Y7_ENGPU|nr:hypothetical protein GDO81_003700 [Engystomops pustulosus]